jgi:predicted ATPase
MQICRLRIKNFRGVRETTIHLPKHGVLLGDNNTGKTTSSTSRIHHFPTSDRIHRIAFASKL